MVHHLDLVYTHVRVSVTRWYCWVESLDSTAVTSSSMYIVKHGGYLLYVHSAVGVVAASLLWD
jgi:hypothetical protein